MVVDQAFGLIKYHLTEVESELDCKTVVFGRFRKAGSALSGRVRRENDCRLFIQRILSKEGPYNVTEVTEIA